MLIPIRLPPTSTVTSSSSPTTDNANGGGGGNVEPEEWSLIELNGTLTSNSVNGNIATGEGLGGLPLGQLSFAAENKPILVIGAHKLEGEVVTLPKPFLIMQKHRIPRNKTSTAEGGRRLSGMSVGSGGGGGNGHETTTPMRGRRSSAGTPGSFGSFGSPAPVMGAPPEEDTEYEVVGVVKTKLLFKERPKPIVSRHLLKS